MARERSPSPRRRRSPSPRRRSPDYKRSSPDYRRDRSRSPRERRRGSPQYRSERVDYRDRYGDREDPRRGWEDRRGERRGGYGGGPDGGELPQDFSGRGGAGRRPREPDDVSEDDIKAENYQDFRRLKRQKMLERNVRCIWRNTPSPPPEEKDRILAQRREKLRHKADKETVAANGKGAAAPAAAADGDEGLDPELLALARGNVPADGTAELPAAEEEAEDEVEAAISAKEVELFKDWLAEQKRAAEEEEEERRKQDEEDAMVGPAAPGGADGAGFKADYGTHMMKGEAEAMAAYVQSGQRIPRRGEVGLDSDQIETFERAGYVMSGSRHSRMNAVRIRKENQVYTAEEKAALAMFNFEENKRKEAKILEDMKRLVQSTLGGPEDEVGPAPPPA